ncbi:hypothetical protein IWQ47_000437 [Aquimarina sp. EL_43]|uniref:hypothetical protein n=1 Tax=Aquimarina TaxID=290174 RepID=UPI00046F316B|nr:MULTISPECIES: hypothetical protein [Aquimarina]MBG6128870.1 hypothetical protein [Aquimarina sp. EL_35]MBG6149934.1 hypothetical protein [Aquimarina sp. EL_32]MBG6167379.1 hypothetical protein [Aquimarina sp. EL_43]
MKIVKLAFFVFFVLTSVSSFSQKIVIDYFVDYEIETKNKKDTITIGFSKNGDYLYTDSDALVKSFQRSVFKRRNTDIKNSEMHIVFDIKKQFVYFLMTFDKNEFFMKMNVNDFIPSPKNKSPFDGITQFIFEKTEDNIQIENKDYNIHQLYPDSEPEEKIKIAYSKEMKFNNSILLNSIYKMMSGSNTSEDIKIPKMNGVILYLASKNKTLIKAVKTDSNPKTLDINFSYKITE